MPKKVLHIIPSLSRGGAETLLCNSIKLLQEFDHIIVLLDQTTTSLECNANIIRLHAKIPQNIISVVTKLNSIIKDYNPSIINAHLYWAVILVRLCTTNKTPVLQWYHSDLYNTKNKEQFSYKRLFLDQLTLKKSHNLIFVSKHLKKQVSLQLGSSANQFVIYNFVNPKFYSLNRKTLPSNNQPMKILVVGNLRKQKNQLTLLKALTLVPPHKVHATIVGEGPMRPIMEKFIDDNNLKNVELLGSKDNIAHYLNESDIFVMPSLFEGFGISLLEAMAAGRPCIVSDIPIFRELGESSLIYFNPKDFNQLAEKLLFITDQNLQSEYGYKAYERALKFKPDQYLNDMRNIYNELIT